jgi:uncharacterized protein YndB with AHSA1/START domain
MSELVLERTIALRCSPAHAFRVFTGSTDLWWPRGHRRTPTATMVFEPMLGGRLLERAPDGSEWVIGKVTAIEPPEHLSFDWFPGSPAAPTAVDVDFREAGGGAEINIVHRALSAGAVAAWPGKVALFERGWDTVLPSLAKQIEDQPQET